MTHTTSYHYDPNLGDRRATYHRADERYPELGKPEVPGVFVVDVDGETIINTMHGRQTRAWHSAAGTPCIILGHWSDDTVHLKWPAINGTYRIDGRFPSWVAEVDRDATMAGGGRVLRANDPPVARPGPPGRLIAAAVLLIVLVLALALPPVRDVVASLIHLA
jgi:hypothetical protein